MATFTDQSKSASDVTWANTLLTWATATMTWTQLSFWTNQTKN